MKHVLLQATALLLDLVRAAYLIKVVWAGHKVVEQGQPSVRIRVGDDFLPLVLEFEVPEELVAGEISQEGDGPRVEEQEAPEDAEGVGMTGTFS